ncbi:MAG: nitrogenase component 1, partial [Methylococcaceae bacterium]|nr:nitrogenase component 1 [Methylococcaceae bacterium]
AERLGTPILRAGFPLFDIIGGYQKTWIGYRGTRQTLFDLANLVINYSHEEIPVYHSIYGQKPADELAKFDSNNNSNKTPSCH